MKITFGIPTAGAPSDPFLQSVAGLALPPQATAFDRSVVQGNFVPAQRELIAEHALQTDADVLFMCDDDMVLPSGALTDLCDVLDAQPQCGLAGALYYSRDGFRPMTVDNWNPDDTTSATIPAFDDRTPVRVDGVGFGCVAIRVAALRVLTPPYFPAHVFIERSAGRVRVCDEDYFFCALLRARGWDVVLHPGVRAGHFNRATGTIAPASWESAADSNHPRMVVTENGQPRLVSATPNIACSAERHMRAAVDYLIVD